MPSVFALDVSGALTGETTWTISDSPVQVVGDLEVPSGASLNIAPGVRIVFQGPYALTVRGTLRAVGARGTGVPPVVDSLITFTAAQPAVDSLRWKGIRFIGASTQSRLTYCVVQHGWARGEWPQDRGGGIYIEGCSPAIQNCEILNNRATGDGGGIYGWFTTSSIRNCVIAGNLSIRFGGGIFVDYSSPSLVNNTICRNEAKAWGGGLFAGSNSTPEVRNCILTYNVQRDTLDGNVIFSDDVFFPDLAQGHGAEVGVSFSCIRTTGLERFPGSGNIAAVPEFINHTVQPYDFHLHYYSPCIDAGDPQSSAILEPDVLVNRVNMGAYGNTPQATRSVPVIKVDTDSIGYGNVRTRAQVPREINIENLGHFRLVLQEFCFTSLSFFPDSTEDDNDDLVPEYSVTPIEPGESARYKIHFLPTTLGAYSETLTILSNDTLHPNPTIDLTGTGIDPIGEIADSVEFGEVAIGDTMMIQVQMRNTGNSTLTIPSSNNPVVQGKGFDVDVIDRSIEPGENGTLEIYFFPDFAQPFQANVSIRTNDRDFNVILTGEGVGPKMVISIDSLFIGYAWAGGATISRPVWIANTGADSSILRITDVTISDPVFWVDLPPEGLAIADSDSVALDINFTPTEANHDYRATVLIQGNYPLDDSVRVRGRGMSNPGRYMFGEVSGVWDWPSVAPDTIVILESVYVAPQTRLRIMPGAVIKFEPEAFFTADGELMAVGTAEDSIRFIPGNPAGTPEARWGGINLSRSDATRLSFCAISGAVSGLNISESSPVVRFCTISGNGDSSAVGGGIFLENSGASIAGCVIENNLAGAGGGIYILNSIPRITNCLIRNNDAAQGGGIYLRFLAGALIQSNVIYGNSGGAIYLEEHSSPRLVNNTIVDNLGGAVTARVRSLPVVMNTILWENGGPSLDLASNSNALVSYSDVEGNPDTTTNLSVDPLFGTAPDEPMPYQLSDASPLIDRGNSEFSHRDYYKPPSLGTPRNDIGAYGGPLCGGWETVELAISVFQNPAFPQWLDIFVVTLDTLAGAPVCSMGVAGVSLSTVSLARLSPLAWRGSYEADESGFYFITVEATVASGPIKVGRNYTLALIEEQFAGLASVPLVGVDGFVEFSPGSLLRDVTVFAGVETNPLKPQEDSRYGVILYLTPEFQFWGLENNLASPAKIRLSLPGLNQIDRSRLIILRREKGIWSQVPSHFEGDLLTAEVTRGGRFAVALAEYASPPQEIETPDDFILLSAYPNPFNRKVAIDYEISEAGPVRLAIYDLTGRLMLTLLDGRQSAGRHRSFWDGQDMTGSELSSGIYWARLKTASGERAIKLLLLR